MSRAAAWLVVLLAGACPLLAAQAPDGPTGESAQPTAQAPDGQPAPEGEAGVAPATLADSKAAELYTRHCAACHGERGDGAGPAAVFLYPKPRNFREGRFRLISTINGVPTLADLEQSIRRGLPGSAMVPWPHLSPEELKLLAEFTLEFRRQGVRDFELATAAENGDDPPDEDYLRQAADDAVAAGEVLAVPPFPQPTAESLLRGKEIYVRQGCVSCHGAEGRGDGQQQMIDSEGFATRPRDLTRGIYKGPSDFASVFRRLKLGLPGSPMPASGTLTDEQIADATHFVLSLSDQATRDRQVLRRERIVARRVKAAPTQPDDAAWKDARRVALRTTPLWWRDDPEIDLTVEALHDGRHLAVRLAWRDDQRDAAAIEADQFEDLVAIQWCDGPEPFLGMGADSQSVDLWQWRAGGRESGEERWQSDEYPFESEIYERLAEGWDRPNFITALALGNPLATHARDAGDLRARGFGTTTFVPRVAEEVSAESQWSDGRWTVVLRRALETPREKGVVFQPGERRSAAFAVWNGASRDRAGQKRITIWQDFELE